MENDEIVGNMLTYKLKYYDLNHLRTAVPMNFCLYEDNDPATERLFVEDSYSLPGLSFYLPGILRKTNKCLWDTRNYWISYFGLSNIYFRNPRAGSPIKEAMRKFEARKFRILCFFQWSSHLFCVFLSEGFHQGSPDRTKRSDWPQNYSTRGGTRIRLI